MQRGGFFVDLQYADDIGNHSTGIKQQKLQIPSKLEDGNLNINLSKIEKNIINRESKGGPWKKCKYLDTLLDTEEDIKKCKHSA